MSEQTKYKYPEPIKIKNRQWPDRILSKAPIWTSVDLRDGNQALPIPMDVDKKLAYFNMLVEIGFKEIEIGFPSASQDDFDFCRRLIDDNLIPADVRISVLTQARKHLIDRTLEAIQGVHSAIVHCYVATSDLHRKFVFGYTREQVVQLAVDGTAMIRDGIARMGIRDHVAYEFSPEEFTDSDLDFVVGLCEAVHDTWKPVRRDEFILNLPATVERRPPNQYADMIEYFCGKYRYMADTIVSLHAHNDQGCAVAATELALLAGATRVEGTIFGHGERTGNLDISILALNMESRGINTGLHFDHMSDIVRMVENASGIEVHPRHPYAGALVFTAFSGSHQDAIRKGMAQRREISEFFGQGWKMPYLHIDPADVGATYENLIRINSQSGKGGVVYVLEKEFGIFPPKAMHPQIGHVVQDYVDRNGGEIDSAKLREIFDAEFLNIKSPFSMLNYQRVILEDSGDLIEVSFTLDYSGHRENLKSRGNGPIAAVVNALRDCVLVPDFELRDFSERTLGTSANAMAMAFVGVSFKGHSDLVYGCGVHSNIDRAALAALFSALNRAAVKPCGQ
ncbi:MAG: 2-isopropylmalate synthase [Victivallaceae bacterium]|nr:2-isopropylmalate synthase [Victivallaceae bacterium]